MRSDILRMSLEAFSFARHLTFKGLTAEEGIASLTAIIAGTTFAPDVLYLRLMHCVRRTLRSALCLQCGIEMRRPFA